MTTKGNPVFTTVTGDASNSTASYDIETVNHVDTLSTVAENAFTALQTANENTTNLTNLILKNSIKNITVNDDLTFTFLMNDGSTITSASNIYVNDEGYLISPSATGTLPDDFTTNGGVYIASTDYVSGTKQLPTGLYLNGDVVMTDGTVYFIDTVNNNNVLCAK